MTPSELSDLLWAQVDRVAPHLLPNGKKEGHEWVAGNVNGDKGNSLKVNLSGKKKWADFAEGDGGDMLDLWMACRGINLHQAMQEAKAFLGIKDDDHHFDAKREKKFSRPDRKKIARYVTRTESHLEYLQSRGISPEIVKRYEVVSGKVWNGERELDALVLPYKRDGELLQVKRISTERPNGKKVIMAEGDCEPCLFGWQALDAGVRAVVLCEGEIDCMSYAQYGISALYEFTPYSKQREFIDAGHDYPERCFMAGNQLGKSFTGAAEVAFHLTGRYPGTKGYPADGKYGGEWKGKRFYEPVVFWIGGETNETVTKTTQRILCGRIEENDEPGYGSIPKEDIISWKKSPFFPNLVDHLLVKHHTADGVEDGISICYFKPYSQGRARWQGDTIHGVWFDEEPPYSIYGEGLTRTNKYGQFSILTFTPLMGMSDVVTKFLKNPSKSQKVVNMTIYDAEHYTDEQKEQIIASYPEHEREARARGIPTMGSGRIFQIPEETIKCQPFECPDHFYVIGGMDFGWDHPQAQVQLWWDKDADTIYVSRVWKAKEKTAVQAWGAVKSWAHKVPTAWPHDGNQHEKGGGEQLKGQYADAGFMMLQEHATWPDGGNAVEPGITELRDMMLDGRFKVFNTCEPFFEEFRLYHRDENGKIVKLNDDVLSAVRYAYMMRRFAKMMRDIKKPKEKKIPAPIRPIARRT